MSVQVLMVGEKPSIAKSIAEILSFILNTE